MSDTDNTTPTRPEPEFGYGEEGQRLDDFVSATLAYAGQPCGSCWDYSCPASRDPNELCCEHDA